MLETLLRPIRISNLFLREWGKKSPLPRKPLKQPMIHDQQVLDAYDLSGAAEGDLVPAYHFNTVALSALLPKAGTILDLGCGSARMLVHLAKRRPDIKLIGLDQSKEMIKKAQKNVDCAHLTNRIRLIKANMLKAHEIVSERLDVVALILTTHTLPHEQALDQLLQVLRVLKFRNNCSIWIFDFARPKSNASCSFFPKLFGTKAGEAVQKYLGQAMRASFTADEIAPKLDAVGIGPFGHFVSGPMPFFQIHRLRSEKHYEITASFWKHEPLSKLALSHYKSLKAQFPKSILR